MCVVGVYLSPSMEYKPTILCGHEYYSIWKINLLFGDKMKIHTNGANGCF